MTRWLNIAGMVLAYVLAALGVAWFSPHPDLPARQRSSREAEKGPVTVELSGGERGLMDHTGHVLPLRRYERIVSGSTIADAMLLEFAAPTRIVAFTSHSGQNELFGFRYEGRPQIDALAEMERLLDLNPDLVIVSTLSSASRVQRLRDAGLNVFALGEMRGVESFLRSVRDIATLAGEPELGQIYAQAFESRLRNIARGLPEAERRTAAQLTYFGNRIYGSGLQTSYHDVLTSAGLLDVGAQRYTGWPSLSYEQVLELDPEVLVTRTGMATAFCTQPALSRLRACDATRGQVVELPEGLINDPGPHMLLAAEWLHRAVYGEVLTR